MRDNNFRFQIVDYRFALCTVFFYLFCLTSLVFADYTKDLDKIAGKLAKNIPGGRTVVVFNILKDGIGETQNSVDLAIKLGLKLADRGKKKFNVIDRVIGEKFLFEEKKFTPKEFSSEELKRLLEGFEADVGIVGQYVLVGKTLILENFRAVEVPSPTTPPNIISTYARRVVKLNSVDSLCLISYDVLLPQPPDSIIEYFLSAKTENILVLAQIVDLEEKPLRDGCAKIGDYYRLKVDLSEDIFLYIFSYDENNNAAYLIYPLNRKENKKITTESFLIPSSDMAIEAKAPTGKNFVKIFACKKPIPFTIPQSADWRLTSAEVSNFVKELKRLSINDWASYRIFIHIIEK